MQLLSGVWSYLPCTLRPVPVSGPALNKAERTDVARMDTLLPLLWPFGQQVLGNWPSDPHCVTHTWGVGAVILTITIKMLPDLYQKTLHPSDTISNWLVSLLEQSPSVYPLRSSKCLTCSLVGWVWGMCVGVHMNAFTQMNLVWTSLLERTECGL